MKKFLRKILFLAVLCLLNSFSSTIIAQQVSQAEINSYFGKLPFEMFPITLPSFPQKYFDVKNYGALNDGLTLNTKAFQKAIDECSNSGGGYVVVPSGFWLTGPIELKNNVNLHLERGAMIVFSSNHEDYPIVKVGGKVGFMNAFPISGKDLNNIAITGEGLINGNGQTWRPVKKSKMNSSQWKGLLNSGGYLTNNNEMWWPTKKASEAESFLAERSLKNFTIDDFEKIRDYYRPNLLNLTNCKNVLFDGPTFQNSPKFAIYITKSENIIIRDVKINNEWYAQNGDGIDLSACKNALIYKCTVNAGDDGICMKSSGKHTDGPEMKNIIVADCVVYHAHGGFVIGSNTDGGIENVYVTNCNFVWSDTGLRFKSGIKNGGLVKNIFINNILMKDIANEAIIFDLNYEDKGAAKTKDKKTEMKIPLFTGIHIDRLICEGAKQAVLINDLPDISVRDIELSNSTIVADSGFESVNAENIKLKNVVIKSNSDSQFAIKDGRNFEFNTTSCNSGAKYFLKLTGSKTENIKLINSKTDCSKQPFIFEDGASQKALIVN